MSLGLYRYTTTEGLKPGDKLASCFARKLTTYGDKAPHVSAIGVAQGVVFGDGSYHTADGKPASVSLFGGKGPALLPYFGRSRVRSVRLESGQVAPEVCELPRAWNRLPPVDESLSFLLGWFAGYFAADGGMSPSGNQATLYSHDPSHLQFVNGICYRLGIRVSPVRPMTRTSEGCVPGAMDIPMYAMSFPVRDVPAEFWILDHHRRRSARWLAAASEEQKSHWVVEKVEDLGEVDEVFCAVVPGIEKFTLADNVLTMNCPYCNDTRRRFYVNHLWCTPDPLTGDPMRHLAHCFNEDCLKEHYGEFERAVFDVIGAEVMRAMAARLRVPPTHDAEVQVLRPITPPGRVLALTKLPASHKAVRFLEGRGFDVARLEAEWGVGYLASGEGIHTNASGRIYAPITIGGTLYGWQGRWPGDDYEVHGAPKYYTLHGFPKSRVLYGADQAAGSRSVVVVEGVTDAWKYGPGAVALLGKTVSQAQHKLLTAWADGVCVLMLDAGAWTTEVSPSGRAAAGRRRAELLAELGRTFSGRVFEVVLPEGTDPGDFDREALRRLVRQQARAAGIDLSGGTRGLAP